MGNHFFRFKQFIVNQSMAAMKVGVDSVLLGAWVDVSHVSRVLDVGTGTGLLALMMAQRIPETYIDAVEIDEEACAQARRNVEESPWNKHITVTCGDFRKYEYPTGINYDLVICNPPFFIRSFKSEDKKRNLARHNDTLSHEDLLSASMKLLSSDGIVAVVLPATEARLFLETAASHGLYPKRQLQIQSYPSKPPHRLLLELSKTNGSVESSILSIENHERTDFTDAYKEMTREFYVKF
ncbi:MAG: methyltransferase [Bacteroidales bacterium]|jgi:tRNA1Val (adenine37-N6)-methyltransferase|nr:methyltransferase [Bacteroidales bacterium]